MQPLYYDVAVSADGFIADANEDVSRFPHTGPIVDAYLERLSTYAVAVMGAETFRFGLEHGLPLGANPYPTMRTIVLSNRLEVPEDSQVSVSRDAATEVVANLRHSAEGPIYLCGGGRLAASLLRAGLITALRLKRAPVLLGQGVSLFEGPLAAPELRLVSQKSYADGTLFQELSIV